MRPPDRFPIYHEDDSVEAAVDRIRSFWPIVITPDHPWGRLKWVWQWLDSVGLDRSTVFRLELYVPYVVVYRYCTAGGRKHLAQHCPYHEPGDYAPNDICTLVPREVSINYWQPQVLEEH